jgi:hypothetical protein
LSRRRFLGGFSAAVATFGCGRRRATGFPGFALIPAAGENTLAFVDLNTFRLSHKLDLASAPSSISADPDRAYLLTPETGAIHIIDAANPSERRSLRVGSHVDFIRLTPARGELLAASSATRELILADAISRRVVRRVNLDYAPADLDVRLHSESRRVCAAVSGGASGIVEVLDLHNRVRRKRQLSAELGSIRFREDGKILFAANYRDQSLVVLDTATLNTICELPLPMRPENFSFTGDQGQLFVSGTGMDAISIVYVYDTIEVEQTILSGRTPGAMACSESPRYLFVASRAGSEISILNIENRKMVGLAHVGDRPSRIVITPDQQYALVLNEGSGDLAVVRIPAITGNRSKNGESLPSGILTLRGVSLFAMIPVGSHPTDLAILPQRS